MSNLRHLYTPLTFLLHILHCSAYRIRSPPPLLADFGGSTWECNGKIDGWHWDRCSLDHAVLWTSSAFGHKGFKGDRVSHYTMGGHVQYTPFTAEHPFLLSFESHEDGRKFSLPPIFFSVYIDSDVQQSYMWNPKMTVLLDSDAGWVENILKAEFHCDSSQAVEILDGALILRTNTEYLLDNVVLQGFEHSLFPERMPSHIYWLNAHATLEAQIAGPDSTSQAATSISWTNSFAVAHQRPETQTVATTQKSSATRAFAGLVSHKLCESSELYLQNQDSQRYDVATRTLGIRFQSNTGIVPITLLSASVTHDGRGRAVAEFLIWIEDHEKCENVDIIGGNRCAASNASSLISSNLSCVVRRRRSPARFDTKMIKNWADSRSRETVVSCVFNSSDFSLDDHTVHVDFVDTFSSFKVRVPLCSLQRDRQIHRIVACSQPIYNAGHLEARWPGLLQLWVLYHASFPQTTMCCNILEITAPNQVKYLGFDHFTFYDVDGSAAPYLSSLLNSTFFTYFHRWAPVRCLLNLTATRKYPYCTETLENQCLWNSRGNSEWAMLIHAPDCFLNDSPGLPKLFGLLDSMDHSKSSLLLPTVLFEAAPGERIPQGGNSSSAADIFTVFNSRVCSILNGCRHVPVFDPHMINVSIAHSAIDVTLEAQTHTATLAVNHYIQMFSNRTSQHASALTGDGMLLHPNGSPHYCIDSSMAHLTAIMSSLLETHTGGSTRSAAARDRATGALD
jgi:hypothetical protein